MREFSRTKLREIRKNKGLTQVQLAENARTSYYLVRNVEQGQTRPSVRAVVRFADALRVPVDAFFEHANDDSAVLTA